MAGVDGDNAGRRLLWNGKSDFSLPGKEGEGHLQGSAGDHLLTVKCWGEAGVRGSADKEKEISHPPNWE